MYRLFRRIRNVLKWNKAADQASQKQWSDALHNLQEMDTENLGHLKFDYYILKSYLLMCLNNREEFEISIKLSKDILNKSRSLSIEEKTYRRKYIEWLSVFFNEGPNEKELDYSEIDLSLIARRTKDYFPLRNHPLWQE